MPPLLRRLGTAPRHDPRAGHRPARPPHLAAGPGRRQRHRQIERVLRRRGRGTRRSGPEPETSPRARPYSSPDRERARAAPGSSDTAAGCRSLVSRAPTRVRVAGPQRVHHLGRHPRLGQDPARAEPVELAGRPSGWTGPSRRGRGPSGTPPRPARGSAARRGRCPAPCRRAAANGTSDAQLRGEVGELGPGQPGLPERVAGDKAAAASALPPAIPPATGMPLRMCSRTRIGRRRRRSASSSGRADRQVASRPPERRSAPARRRRSPWTWASLLSAAPTAAAVTSS